MTSSLLPWIAAALAFAGLMGALYRGWALSRLLHEKSSQHDQLKAQILEWNRRLEEKATGRERDLEQISRRLEETYIETVTSFIEAMSAKDNYLYDHSINVSLYAAAVAEELGFSPEKIRRLQAGCKLHDLGKIAVPDSILMKAGPLTKEEFEIIKTHPMWGARILQSITSMKDITEMVHQEHERWDGTGYPQGLKGERIRLEARIISVADALDAMISKRPYRQSVTIEKASQELARCAGTHFDPQVVEACLQAIRKGRLVPLSEGHPRPGLSSAASYYTPPGPGTRTNTFSKS